MHSASRGKNIAQFRQELLEKKIFNEKS